ncbi:MAG: ABC transporter substrate-binding protein [Anaerolineales bacterium]|nr:ABC transporter substrate-binding protein [Anaerolineales bacterium]
MTKILKAIVLIAALSSVMLVGCGGDANSNSAGTIDKDGHITIEFWYALGGNSGEVVEELVNQFNQSQTEITVIGTYQGGYASSMAKLWNALSAKTPPAVAQIGGAPLVGNTGAIIPITDFLNQSGDFDRDDIWEVFWDYNSAGGQIWSMPFNHSVPMLFYNRDLFISAGLDPDQPPETWDEVIQYGQLLTTDTDDNGEIDQWGFNTKDDTHWYLSTMFMENGVEIVNSDETEVLYTSPEAVEMLTLWGDFVHKHKIMPPNQHDESKGDFLAGKVGMLLMSSSNVPGTIQDAPFDVGVAMFPTIAGKERVVPVGGASLIILDHDNELIKQAAWTFIKYMANQESSLYLSTHTGYLPIYKAALEWPEMQSYLEDNHRSEEAILQLEYAESIPLFSALGSSDAQLRVAIEAIELGTSSPQEVLDHAKEVVDGVLLDNLQDQ